MENNTQTKTRKIRTRKDELEQFIKFMFREENIKKENNLEYPFKLYIKNFEKETGIQISAQTAYKNKNKWELIDGDLYKKRVYKNKEINE